MPASRTGCTQIRAILDQFERDGVERVRLIQRRRDGTVEKRDVNNVLVSEAFAEPPPAVAEELFRRCEDAFNLGIVEKLDPLVP